MGSVCVTVWALFVLFKCVWLLEGCSLVDPHRIKVWSNGLSACVYTFAVCVRYESRNREKENSRKSNLNSDGSASVWQFETQVEKSMREVLAKQYNLSSMWRKVKHIWNKSKRNCSPENKTLLIIYHVIPNLAFFLPRNTNKEKKRKQSSLFSMQLQLIWTGML